MLIGDRLEEGQVHFTSISLHHTNAEYQRFKYVKSFVMLLTSNTLLLANKLLWYVSKSESRLQEFTILKYIPAFNPELEMVKMIIFEVTISTVSNKHDNKFQIMTQKLNQRQQ
jgi:hypothetical protein